MAKMIRKRSLTELSRKSRKQFDLSKRVHWSRMDFGQSWLPTFKWGILSPNGSFRSTRVDLNETVTTHEAKTHHSSPSPRSKRAQNVRLRWHQGQADDKRMINWCGRLLGASVAKTGGVHVCRRRPR